MNRYDRYIYATLPQVKGARLTDVVILNSSVFAHLLCKASMCFELLMAPVDSSGFIITLSEHCDGSSIFESPPHVLPITLGLTSLTVGVHGVPSAFLAFNVFCSI